jgi:N-acetylmuramoyl-L-alanine amidase
MLPLRGTLTLYDPIAGDTVLISRSEWFFCRAESGYHEVDPGLAIWRLRQLSGYQLERARTFAQEAHLQCFDVGWMRPAGLYDHRPIDIVIAAIRDRRVLVLQRGAAAVPAKSATAELRGLVAQLPQRGTLVFQGRQYKLVVADDLARLANRDRYEVVSQSAARDVLDGLAKESPASGQALGQASERIGKDWRPPFSQPEGLVLLRRIPVRSEGATNNGPAITPAQMKQLLQKAALDIHVVDLRQKPQKDLAYNIAMPDGASASGKLDADGRARARSSQPGTFTVTFPELDGADWDGDGALALTEGDRSEASEYAVQQGDRLPTIARAQGFLRWQTVWEFAANADLRKLRGTAHILLPGDKVAIPSQLSRKAEVPGGQAEYVVQSAAEVLRVRFAGVKSSDESPVTFRATPDTGDAVEGSLPADGQLEVDLPPATSKVHVELSRADSEEEQPFLSHDFTVGGLDPSDTTSGIQARLQNLGFYQGPLSGSLDDDTRAAISHFRWARLGDQKDEVDDDLLAALHATHGR